MAEPGGTMSEDEVTGTSDATTSDSGASGPVPEFRIVRRNADRRGPLAPYRLAIAIVVIAVVAGPALWASVRGGTPDDALLLRAAGIGLLVWVTTGIVSKALADASLGTDGSDPKPS